MFKISPITNNLFAAPAAMPMKAQAVHQNKPAPPAFGLESISFGSFGGKTLSSRPVTPKLDMTQPAGQRLNYLA